PRGQVPLRRGKMTDNTYVDSYGADRHPRRICSSTKGSRRLHPTRPPVPPCQPQSTDPVG
ncbi:hypothetical protein RZS08_51910, partial [Arthrospira platensis SPKY1]|nr:hypothetical protein [Arthrospira platensis SPKY1]